MTKMAGIKLRILLIVILFALFLSPKIYAQEGKVVFSIASVIPGENQALILAGYQHLTDCYSMGGCYRAGKLSWFLYDGEKFKEINLNGLTPLFWNNGWILERIVRDEKGVPKTFELYRYTADEREKLLSLNVSVDTRYNFVREYSNGSTVMIVHITRNGFPRTNHIYFFDLFKRTISEPIVIKEEFNHVFYGNGVWFLVYRYGDRGGVYAIKEGKVYHFSKNADFVDFSFNGTHVLIVYSGYVNRTLWNAVYIWNFTDEKFILNTTAFRYPLRVYGWNQSWYLGGGGLDWWHLYKLENRSLKLVSTKFVSAFSRFSGTPALVVGSKIIWLKGLADTDLSIYYYTEMMEHWLTPQPAPFNGSVAYVEYERDRKLVIVKDNTTTEIPLNDKFGFYAIIPTKRYLLLLRYIKDGDSALLKYQNGRLVDLTQKLEALCEKPKPVYYHISNIKAWRNTFLVYLTPSEGHDELFHYNGSFKYVGRFFYPLGQFGRFYIINNYKDYSHIYNGSCIHNLPLKGIYTDRRILIAVNGTTTQAYVLEGDKLKSIAIINETLYFWYKAGPYPVFLDKKAFKRVYVFDGRTFHKLPFERRNNNEVAVAYLNESLLIVHAKYMSMEWKNKEEPSIYKFNTTVYRWDLTKIAEFHRFLIPLDYKNDSIILGYRSHGVYAPNSPFKGIYAYNRELRVLFEPKDRTVYYYINGTVVAQSCIYGIKVSCSYRVFTSNKKMLGEFKGTDTFDYTFWKGELYLSNGTHLIKVSKSLKSLKLPIKLYRVRMTPLRHGIVLWGVQNIVLYNGTFKDLSDDLVRAFLERKDVIFCKSSPLKGVKKEPISETHEVGTTSKTLNTSTAQISKQYTRNYLLFLAAILLLIILLLRIIQTKGRKKR